MKKVRPKFKIGDVVTPSEKFYKNGGHVGDNETFIVTEISDSDLKYPIATRGGHIWAEDELEIFDPIIPLKRLKAFLYLLMRDELPSGKCYALLNLIGNKLDLQYSSGGIANEAESMAKKILLWR